VPISRRIAALLVAAVLLVPASAAAQTTTIPRGGADVSNTPPVPLSGGTAAGSADGAAELPNTGTDPRLLFLCGLALTLLGVGLRLRTADAELY
jgi:hypothetical protein